MPPRTLLRGTLRRLLTSLGASAESTLSLEYAPALQPPVPAPGPPAAAEDWVASLAGCESLLAAGLFNGRVLLRSAPGGGRGAGAPLSLQAHAGAVHGLALLELSGARALLASCGADGRAGLWEVAGAGARGGAPTAEPRASLAGAAAGLTCCALDPTGQLLAAGDAAGGLAVWAATAAPAVSVGAGAGAKRARAPGAEPPGGALVAACDRAPLGVLAAAHAPAGPLSGVGWSGGPATLVSAGWGDACLRVWAVRLVPGGGAALALSHALAMPSHQAPTGLALSPSGALAATAHADGRLRVWRMGAAGGGDGPEQPAAGGGSGSLLATLALPQPAPPSAPGGPQSTAWVAALSWCPASAHLLAAVGHSGAAAVFDVRAPPAPLFELQRHCAPSGAPARALAVCWAGARAPTAGEGLGAGAHVGACEGLAVVSGGADQRLRVSAWGAVVEEDALAAPAPVVTKKGGKGGKA